MSRWATERVLVAIKPWQRGLPLESQHASQLADALGAQLMIASAVFDARVASRAGRGDAAALAARARLIEAERIELEKLAQSLRAWGTAVSTRVVWSAPAYQGVLDVAREWRADLLVVGVHERGLEVGTRLTDTDWQLMRLAPCPLLLVKNPFFTGYRTVLAAIDPAHREPARGGNEGFVLEVARSVSEACESELRVVHALPDPARLPPSPVEIAPGVYCDADAIEDAASARRGRLARSASLAAGTARSRARHARRRHRADGRGSARGARRARGVASWSALASADRQHC